MHTIARAIEYSCSPDTQRSSPSQNARSSSSNTSLQAYQNHLYHRYTEKTCRQPVQAEETHGTKGDLVSW